MWGVGLGRAEAAALQDQDTTGNYRQSEGGWRVTVERLSGDLGAGLGGKGDKEAAACGGDGVMQCHFLTRIPGHVACVSHSCACLTKCLHVFAGLERLFLELVVWYQFMRQHQQQQQQQAPQQQQHPAPQQQQHVQQQDGQQQPQPNNAAPGPPAVAAAAHGAAYGAAAAAAEADGAAVQAVANAVAAAAAAANAHEQWLVHHLMGLDVSVRAGRPHARKKAARMHNRM